MDQFKRLEPPFTQIAIDDRTFRLAVDTYAERDQFEGLHDAFSGTVQALLADPTGPDSADLASAALAAATPLMRFVLRFGPDGQPGPELTDEWLQEHVFAHLYRPDEILREQIALLMPRGMFGAAALAMRQRTKPEVAANV